MRQKESKWATEAYALLQNNRDIPLRVLHEKCSILLHHLRRGSRRLRYGSVREDLRELRQKASKAM